MEYMPKDFPQAAGRKNEAFAEFLRDMDSKLKPYRIGIAPISLEYIEGHEHFALIDINRLNMRGWRVEGYQLVNDGWMDAMKFIQIFVRPPLDQNSETIYQMKWSDSGQWYVKTPGGGWALA